MQNKGLIKFFAILFALVVFTNFRSLCRKQSKSDAKSFAELKRSKILDSLSI
jgi:hypothetical protein